MKQKCDKSQAQRPAKPIVLIGSMGAGKTRIGRMLAESLNLGFVDNDDEIETAAGMDIPSIFRDYGEEDFRNLEARVLRRLLEQSRGGIISVGGGAFMRPESRALILERAIALWLKAEPETLAARISDTRSRPMLQRGDPTEVLRELAATRYPVYAEAHLVVETDGLSPGAAAVKTEAALRAHLGMEEKDEKDMAS